jgi:hypothetical protein
LPFGQDVPDDALYVAPRVENFALRVLANINEGGYALCTGEPGQGKSVVSRLIARRLGQLDGVKVGCIDHPQSRVSDFYRELGDHFDIQMNIYNRFSGFKALRVQWLEHIESTLVRPVLLIDEAQEMASSAFTELRILSSKDFDARCKAVDVVVTPAACGEAPEGLHTTGDWTFNAMWTVMHTPCVAIPCIKGPKGLPVGVQIVGPRFTDARLLSIGEAVAPVIDAGT